MAVLGTALQDEHLATRWRSQSLPAFTFAIWIAVQQVVSWFLAALACGV